MLSKNNLRKNRKLKTINLPERRTVIKIYSDDEVKNPKILGVEKSK